MDIQKTAVWCGVTHYLPGGGGKLSSWGLENQAKTTTNFKKRDYRYNRSVDLATGGIILPTPCAGRYWLFASQAGHVRWISTHNS